MAKFAPDLYKLLRDTINLHVQEEIRSLPTTSSTVDAFLKAVETVWHRHCTHMSKPRSFFLYLDRTYIVQGSARPDARSFWEMGLLIFPDELFTSMLLVLALISVDEEDEISCMSTSFWWRCTRHRFDGVFA